MGSLFTQEDEEKSKRIPIKIDASKVIIREMKESEIEEANRIQQLAFYDFIQSPGCLQNMMVYARRYVNEMYVTASYPMAVHLSGFRLTKSAGAFTANTIC